MWVGCVFANTVHYGICILSLTRMVMLGPLQYSTLQYGVRILSVRTTKAVDKVREAVIYSLCQTSVCFLEHLGQNSANFV
jgi:hypothetical protein